ncbi:MAG: hypothetical protein WAM66_09385 [Acidobacteriaceae bacterium]
MSHITIAASAKAFQQLFNQVENNFSFSKSDTANFGPFSASYSVSVHLSGGSLQLNNDNTIELQDVDIVFGTLDLKLCFNLPVFPIPGFCLVPDPWNGCLVGFPGFNIGGPVCLDLNLSGLTSQITDLKANLLPKYYIDPARQPGWTDLDAELNGHSNQWQIFIDPVLVNVTPIDVPATIDNILMNAIHTAVENMLPSWLPGWAVDFVMAVLDPIIDGITALLGIVTGAAEWLSDLLGNLFGLVSLLETAIADYFASKYPLFQFEDPFQILPASGGLIPVKIPIRNLAATIDSQEMIVQANVGA